MAASNQSRYERYVDDIQEDIGETIRSLGCQPILFVGSGFSRRYFEAPSWDELLAELADKCPVIDKDYAFYKQSLSTPQEIGQRFAIAYQEWAWSEGRSSFPTELFSSGVRRDAYIKFVVAEILKNLTPKSYIDLEKAELKDELDALKSIKPHSIITTNYDDALELVFPDHTPILGQHILKASQVCVGEIFKIHGGVDDYQNIVFTKDDYDEFYEKKKFLSAKLLTFFNEHPVLFVGYSASDPNIRGILSDIDQALPEKGGVIPNVYILEWNPDVDPEASPVRDRVIATENGRTVRVKSIEASDFAWVFNAFGANPPLNDVNPRVLRALIARSYELVRHDIPKMTVHADFHMLTNAVENNDAFAQLFGIANIKDYSAASAQYPYSSTEMGISLGTKHWTIVNRLVSKIESEKGINIKTSDNRYHRTDRVNKTPYHKWSHEALELFIKVRDSKEYILDLS